MNRKALLGVGLGCWVDAVYTEIEGISPDVAAEVAKRLGTGLRLVPFPNPKERELDRDKLSLIFGVSLRSW